MFLLCATYISKRRNCTLCETYDVIFTTNKSISTINNKLNFQWKKKSTCPLVLDNEHFSVSLANKRFRSFLFIFILMVLRKSKKTVSLLSLRK